VDSATLVVVAVLGVFLVVILILLLVQVFRKPQDISSVSVAVQGLSQSLSALQADLRLFAERVSLVERGQTMAGQGIAAIYTKLAETATMTQDLSQATSAVRSGLASTQEALAAIGSRAAVREGIEQQTAESIRRLEAVIAGTKTKGVAGENILEMVFSQLPADWQVRDFQVGNKVVEFGLRLPNNLVLPIDSKWAATSLMEQFLACEDPARQQAIKAEIEKAVMAKAKEVRKYVDPSITVNFGVAAVPDAVFDLCSGIQVQILQMGVVLISYSMFVPYLLLVFQTMLKTSREIDVQRLGAHLEAAQTAIRELQEELEGRLSRGVTMIGNAQVDMRAHLGKVSGALTAMQLGAAVAPPEETAGTSAQGERS